MDIKLQTKVTDLVQTANNQQQLTLSGGDKMITDLYIPTFGLIPNSSYVPAKFLNADGYVVVDRHLQVKGTENVWAVGDVSDVEPAQFITTDKQSAHLAKNIVSLLRDNNKTLLPYKVGSSRTRSLLFCCCCKNWNWNWNLG